MSNDDSKKIKELSEAQKEVLEAAGKVFNVASEAIMNAFPVGSIPSEAILLGCHRLYQIAATAYKQATSQSNDDSDGSGGKAH